MRGEGVVGQGKRRWETKTRQVVSVVVTFLIYETRNCKDSHRINAVNVGSTRDLISWSCPDTVIICFSRYQS